MPSAVELTVPGAMALGSAFNVLSGVGSGIAGAISAKKNREWNEKMWHMQNEYNTPAAQMQRMKEAGLNPNLAYGQLSSSNAGQVGTGDVYNSKGWTEAIGKINLASSAVELAKAKQELKAQRLENDFKEEQLDEYRNQRSAEEEWADLNSEYGQQMKAKGYVRMYDSEGHGYWLDPKTSEVTGVVRKFRTSHYLLNKLTYELQNINSGIRAKDSRTTLTDTINVLRGLDKEYLKNRNSWQNWLNGVDAGSKSINSLLPVVKFIISLFNSH